MPRVCGSVVSRVEDKSQTSVLLGDQGTHYQEVAKTATYNIESLDPGDIEAKARAQKSRWHSGTLP